MGEFAGGLPPEILLEEARQAASKLGYSLDASFEEALLNALKSHWHEPGHNFEEARTNTNRFIMEAVNIGRLRAKPSLDRDTFDSVLTIAGFCPLWPFC